MKKWNLVHEITYRYKIPVVEGNTIKEAQAKADEFLKNARLLEANYERSDQILFEGMEEEGVEE
ncbi:hypothetical protein CMI37_35530 [Candidatus Pacearchaeota archaeon]|nr:hypothetical protein [Candidatus Pacearchaeota archaeon]|tara:strand:+ start:2653 stop:2844 length:192 start_codon:yes stop_codon:yes gene_type:complete